MSALAITPSLLAQGLQKNFGSFEAVRDLSFSISPGESVAFLGANGAGKSTTIKILCGILTPTSGLAQIQGLAAGSKAASQKLGLVFGTRSQLYLHMTVEQSLDLIAEIYFVPDGAREERIRELAKWFELEALLSKRVRTLSLGQRMRCELVAALLHRPAVVLADEPTIGMDVVAKNQFRALVRRWQSEEKTTLLLTSHDLSDVEALCQRCILIDHGKKCYDGPLKELRGALSSVRRIRVTTATAENQGRDLDPRLQARGTGSEAFVKEYELDLSKIAMAEALAKISGHFGDALQDVSISEVRLEEVLQQRYGGRPA